MTLAIVVGEKYRTIRGSEKGWDNRFGEGLSVKDKKKFTGLEQFKNQRSCFCFNEAVCDKRLLERLMKTDRCIYLREFKLKYLQSATTMGQVLHTLR